MGEGLKLQLKRTQVLENRTALAATRFYKFVRDILKINRQIWAGKPGLFDPKRGGGVGAEVSKVSGP